MWSVWQTCRRGRRAAGFLGGLLVALLLAAGPVTGEPLPNQRTLSNGGEATSPVVAAGLTSSGQVQVYFAWKEGQDIYLKRALASPGSCGSAGTLEFDAAGGRQLSSFNSTLFLGFSSPAIAANARGEVFVAWVETPKTGLQYIRLSRALEGGTPSLQPVDFVNFNSTFPGARPNLPAVAADDNGGLFVAAEGTVPAGVTGTNRTAVLLARSLDGQPFDYVNLTAKVLDLPVLASTRRPSIASDGSKVHVVYRNGGVFYRGFDRRISQTELDKLDVTRLTTLSVSVSLPPKVAVHGGEVTAAWFEGTSLIAVTTTNGTFPAPGSVPPIHSAPMRLSNLSLSVGPAGPLFGWQEADTSTSSNHYLLQAVTARPYESGSFFEFEPSSPTSGPSVAQDGTGRVVASWKEGTTPAQITRGYTGGSGSGQAPVLQVRHAPQTLNANTMDRGNTVINFWIRGVQGDIVLSTVTVNGKLIPPIRSAVDENGDLQLTFYRTALKGASNGSYTIAGSTTNPTGCFQASNQVHIIP